MVIQIHPPRTSCDSKFCQSKDPAVRRWRRNPFAGWRHGRHQHGKRKDGAGQPVSHTEAARRFGTIQAQPQRYLEALLEFESKPQFELRRALVDKLEQALRLRSAAELTPQYLSNITASQLLERGVTLVAIAELQEWLSSHDLSLKRRPPETESDIREAQRAIALLDAFHFDTDIVEQQLANLVQEEDTEVSP